MKPQVGEVWVIKSGAGETYDLVYVQHLREYEDNLIIMDTTDYAFIHVILGTSYGIYEEIIFVKRIKEAEIY